MSTTLIRVNGKAPAAASGIETQVLPPPSWVDDNPSLRDITEDIARPMEARAGQGLVDLFRDRVCGVAQPGRDGRLPFREGNWHLGLEQHRRLGLRHHQLRFLGRHRPCGHVDLGHPASVPPAMAHVDQPFGRGDDDLRRDVRGHVPAIHMGRPWDAFFIFPYFPNQRGPLWVNFRSPLVWDVFAISTYLTISLVFWYLGMIPDLATLRDRAVGGIKKFVFRLLSLGWNGSHRTWSRYEMVSLVLAGLATPLVLSVHSIVSMDFATSLLPGWHTTIFPPYFVAGAIYSGFGMVLTLLIITRSTMNLQRYITLRHLDKMAKVTMLTGMIVGYAYSRNFSPPGTAATCMSDTTSSIARPALMPGAFT